MRASLRGRKTMANQFKKQLGGALRRAREHRGQTQAQVAESIGISVEAYSRIERGVTAPAASTLLALMNVLDLERDDLLKRKTLTRKSPYPKEIMAIASYAMGDDRHRAEVAFVVREDFQNMGVSSQLIDILQEIAIKNGYKGFTATVLKTNGPMLHLFRKKFPGATFKATIDGFEMIADFQGDPPFEKKEWNETT